jgi:uncharacterized cupin superfamily protein
MAIRRVVTGTDEAGREVVASDEILNPFVFDLVTGSSYYDLWSGEEHPPVPNSGQRPFAAEHFPASAGFRFNIAVIEPDATATARDVDPEALIEIDDAMPGMREHMADDGMHATDSVDFVIVLEGAVSLVLEDGEEVPLEVGNVVVQNGSAHAWRNHSESRARMAVFMLGAERVNASG